jgi:hypothetical protein
VSLGNGEVRDIHLTNLFPAVTQAQQRAALPKPNSGQRYPSPKMDTLALATRQHRMLREHPQQRHSRADASPPLWRYLFRKVQGRVHRLTIRRLLAARDAQEPATGGVAIHSACFARHHVRSQLHSSLLRRGRHAEASVSLPPVSTLAPPRVFTSVRPRVLFKYARAAARGVSRRSLPSLLPWFAQQRVAQLYLFTCLAGWQAGRLPFRSSRATTLATRAATAATSMSPC